MKHTITRLGFLSLPIILVAALGLAGCQHSLSDAEQRNAEFGAIKFSQADSATFVSCSGLDSDGDSYVTCNEKKDGAITPLLCSYEGTSAGCKLK